MIRKTVFIICRMKEVDVLRYFHDQIFKMKEGTNLLWLFNIGIEEKWTSQYINVRDVQEEEIIQHMDEILLLVAGKNDIIILREKPRKEYLEYLTEIGIELPTILCPKKRDCSKSISKLVLEDENMIEEIKRCLKKVSFCMVPYAVTKEVEELSKKINIEYIGSESNVVHKGNNKIFIRKLAGGIGLKCPKGKICQTLSEVRNETYLLKKTFPKVCIKRPYGVSGNGVFLVNDISRLERILFMLNKQVIQDGWLVEGWYEDKKDLNAQLYINKSGDVNLFSIKEQILDEKIYRGSIFPVFSVEKTILEEYKRQLNVIGGVLYEEGIRGVVGIDSIISGGEIFPIIEANVRFTLSTYLSFLSYMHHNCIYKMEYYRIPLMCENIWFKIYKKIVEKKSNFTKEKMDGIFLYNQKCADGKCLQRRGRLFVLMVAENKERLKYFDRIMDCVLTEVIEGYESRKDNKK